MIAVYCQTSISYILTKLEKKQQQQQQQDVRHFRGSVTPYCPHLNLNFIYFTTIKKQVISTYMNLTRWLE